MLMWDDGKMGFYRGTLSPVALQQCERPGGFSGCCQFTKLTYTFTCMQGVRRVCTTYIYRQVKKTLFQRQPHPTKPYPLSYSS